MSRLFRLRVKAVTGPGALGKIGQSVEALNGTISSVDLQDIDDASGVFDAVVSLPNDSVSEEKVRNTLQQVGAGELKVFTPAPERIDPVLRSIRWASSIVSAADHADDELVRVIAEICGTDKALLVTRDPASDVEPIRSAFERGEPVVVEVDSVPRQLGLESEVENAAVVLAVPDARLEPERVGVVMRPADQVFTTPEIRRIEAVLALRRRVAILGGTPAVDDWLKATTAGPWLDTF